MDLSKYNRIWLISDTHFNHNNSLRYCGRPFLNANRCDEAMISNINDVVEPNDLLIHLGDVAMHTNPVTRLIPKIGCDVVLVTGNHDLCYVPYFKKTRGQKFIDRMLAEYKKAGFIEILPSSYCIQYKGQFIRLSHFPTKDVTKDYHSVKHLEQRPDDTGILNLCGHVHIEWLKRDNNINVGVDVTDFKPVLLDDMIELWKNGPENINTPNKVRIALWKAYHTVRHWLFGKKKGK